MYEPDVAILIMYGSHDMRHIGFRGLTVVNGTPGIGTSHSGLIFRLLLVHVCCFYVLLLKVNSMLVV